MGIPLRGTLGGNIFCIGVYLNIYTYMHITIIHCYRIVRTASI